MNIHKMDACAVSMAIAAGDVSAAEVMTDTLARIEAVNPVVNAIVSLRDTDALMAEARACDGGARSGWLHGIPIAIKDLTDAAGVPTSMGSPLFAGKVALADDIMVARLRAAGAIVIGKTNTPEFGLGSHTYNPVHGATRNPYDVTRSAGGSSGGAAAALATGMLCVADGSDMMGSLRNPAGWNNVYGFRPSWSLVPDAPLGEMYFGHLATKGPMARTVTDLAALLGTMAGIDRRQPARMVAPELTDLDVSVKGRRIGWLADWGGGLPFEDGIIEASEEAMESWRGVGCDVEFVSPPFSLEEMWEAWLTLRAWSNAGRLGPLYHDPKMRAGLKPEAVWEVERGLALSGADVMRASEVRSRWFRAAARMFERYDAVVLPSAQVWPFAIEQAWPGEIAGRGMDTYHRWMQVVVPASLIGVPALCVPGGFDGRGLPFGLQVMGAFGADRSVLELGQAWHRATGWPQRRPPSV